MTDIVESTEEFLIRRVRKQHEENQDLEAKLKSARVLLRECKVTAAHHEEAMLVVKICTWEAWLKENSAPDSKE